MPTNLFGIPLYIPFTEFYAWVQLQITSYNIVVSDSIVFALWLGVCFFYLYIWLKIIIPFIRAIIFFFINRW